MYRLHKFFRFLLLPALVSCHGCPPFILTDAETRNEFLQYDDRTVPASIKDWINMYGNDTVITGVFDCHEDQGGFEIGVTAACTSDGVCTCTALYNFNECQSCDLNCDADIANLDKGSFSANCSNVKSVISDTCTVECGYTTFGCFPTSTSDAIHCGASIVAAVMAMMMVVFDLVQ